MNKKIVIAIVSGIVIITGLVGFQIYEQEFKRTTAAEYYENRNSPNVNNIVYPHNPQTLYGLSITKDKYLIGENVFLTINNIPMGLKDEIQVFSPEGIKTMTIKIDGDERTGFKQYFKPSLSRMTEICSVEQIIGEWTIIFAGQPDDKLKFEVVDEFLPYSEDWYVDCTVKPRIIQPSLLED